MENVRLRHIATIDEVIARDYYIDIFEHMLKMMSLTVETAKQIPIEHISGFWNEFWMDLPDSMSIQRVPFDAICDLCLYEEDEDWDDDFDDEDWEEVDNE